MSAQVHCCLQAAAARDEAAAQQGSLVEQLGHVRAQLAAAQQDRHELQASGKSTFIAGQWHSQVIDSAMCRDLVVYHLSSKRLSNCPSAKVIERVMCRDLGCLSSV